MCGICGIFRFDSQQAVDRSALENMNRQIVHRGPDDDGFYLRENVGLAMRRLSIIDVKTGHQPISNEDGSIWIVYNGEIYNHDELRRDLAARGHQYRTRSDTETIVHLYEEHGRDCVRHLRGMFAFVIWDARSRKLFAARDRLGIKPFYYFLDRRQFLFGSEIKALLAHPSVKPQFNRSILAEYLAFGYIAGTGTFFSGIQKLPPGHTLEIGETGVPNIAEYWDLKPSQRDPRPEKYYVQAYRELLEGAVGSHLMSEVPLGVFLSGGLDSSAVAAIATKLRGPLQTFSVGYDEYAYSELPYARTVAKHLGAEHHEVLLSRQGFFESLPKLIWHEDEPIVWPSSVSLYFVSQLARQRVTVVLTGEGSDETLAGYTRYPWTLWNRRADSAYRACIPSAVRKWVRDEIHSARLGSVLRRKLEHTCVGRDGESWESFYFDNFYAAFSAIEQSDLLNEDLRAELGSPYDGSMQFWSNTRGSLLSRLLYTDIKTYLVELLMKQDNMSMAASVESRVPFLDHVLVEFAAEIPAKYSTRGLAGKRILKKIAEDLLPASIVHRRKLGFPTPWSGWLAGDQLDEIERTVAGPRALERGFFKPHAVGALFSEHRHGLRDNSNRIWRLLNFELWQRIYADCDTAALNPSELTPAVAQHSAGLPG
jgi:asparagine synthase (glutamine-hydrolysing)